ncbi:hypothetical protein BXZ70DRAFT_116749 [Cristinia sonorae]|uniref:F-box domain-containing protein n=1 Tax=Cristinia sonorae TaxID=1940300 RepID=A0A8K0XQY7_9AGAR|nr:hypothetical protein BXZ70DRAFT_116749 [Cristinia sonorae]
MLITEDVPTEILEKILLNVDLQGVARCCQVCRRFHDIIVNSISIQYRLELAVDGFTDGPPGGLTVGDRLRALRDRRKNWMTMQPTSRKVVFSQDRDYASPARVVRMGAPSRGISEKESVYTGFTVETSRWNAEEDVLVFELESPSESSTPHLRFLSLATQESHSKAFKHTVAFDEFPNYSDGCTVMLWEVFYSYIGFMTRTRTGDVDSLAVYDWKSGTFILTVTSEDSFGYIFPSERYLLLVYLDEDLSPEFATMSAVDLLKVQKQGGDSGLPIEFFVDTLDTNIITCHFLTCYFRLLNASRGLSVQIYFSPKVWHPQGHDTQVPFHVGDSRLLALYFNTDDDDGVAMFIPCATIMWHIEQAEADPSKDRVEWSGLGVTGTRIVGHGQIYHDNFCGMTAFVQQNTFGPTLSVPMYLYNFTPSFVRKCLADTSVGRAPPGVEYSSQSECNDPRFGSRQGMVTKLPAYRVEIPLRLLVHPTHPNDLKMTGVVPWDDGLVIFFRPVDPNQQREYHILSF